MPDISLVAFDLDGTLLDSRQTLRPDVRSAVARLQEEAVFVTIVTGRSLAAAEPFVRELGLITPFGLIHGALVRNIQGLEIVKRAIPEVGVREALELAVENDCIPFVIGCDGGGSLTICEEDRDHPTVKFILSDSATGNEVSGHEVRFVPRDRIRTPAYTVYAVGRKERITRYLESTEAQPVKVFNAGRFPVHAVNAVPELRESHEVIMLNPIGADKETALRAIADTLGVRLENVLAFGDWHNDIPMLQAAGHAVLMGNATRELARSIQHPRLVRTGSNDGTGIVDGLARFGLF